MLISLLDRISRDAEEIFFVGDIFDYWFEYSTVIPKDFYRILTKIDDLTTQDIKINYLMGNHDFGHKNFFKQEFGIEVETGDFDRDLFGKKFLIAHGDGKGKGDTGYKILKSILRNKTTNKLFRLIHPDLGIGIASGSSKKSRTISDHKDNGESDRMLEYAKQVLESGYDYIIMGHRHVPLEFNHSGGKYINLGEWFKHPKIGIWDGTKFNLEDVPKFLSS